MRGVNGRLVDVADEVRQVRRMEFVDRGKSLRSSLKSAVRSGQSALGSRRMVNSMRSPGSTRQDSISVM
jgi:hypothetical protein